MTMPVWELPLVFMSGVLGSVHCIGMCGAISATMNLGTTGLRSSLARQLLWSSGRVFTYTFLGMLCGFAGASLSNSQLLASRSDGVAVQAAFAIFAGLLLVVQGLFSGGWIRRKPKAAGACLTASVFGKFLRGGSRTGVFVAGVLTGFLPCGLVYSFLALAVAATSIWKGMLVMAAFGLGTVPVMLVTGAGLTMASLKLRAQLMRIAAVCVLVTGLLTTGRGIAFAAAASTETPAESCPLCDGDE